MAALAAPRLRADRTDPYGILLATVGLGVLAIAIALEVGGSAQTVAYIAIATALGWAAIVLRHRAAAVGAIAYASFAAIHIAVVEYPLRLVAETDPVGCRSSRPKASSSTSAWRRCCSSAGRRPGSGATRPPAWRPRSTRRRRGPSASSARASWIAYAAPFELAADGLAIVDAGLAVVLLSVAIAFDSGRLAGFLLASVGVALGGFAGFMAVVAVVPPDRLSVDGGAHPDWSRSSTSARSPRRLGGRVPRDVPSPGEDAHAVRGCRGLADPHGRRSERRSSSTWRPSRWSTCSRSR
jgi:hypothetical protein